MRTTWAQGFVKPCPSGGNVTGLTNLGPELGGKRLELLKEAVPKLARVAVLYASAFVQCTPDERGSPSRGACAEVDSSTLGDTSFDGFEKVFAALNKQRPDGLYVLGGPLMRANQKRIAELCVKEPTTSCTTTEKLKYAGGLISYGVDSADIFRLVALFVDDSEGSQTCRLPVEQPTKFEFVINLKTAKQIGLTIPPNVLARADRLIK